MRVPGRHPARRIAAKYNFEQAPYVKQAVMKKVLVIRNVSYETEGLLESLLRDEGLELNIVDFQQDRLGRAAA